MKPDLHNKNFCNNKNFLSKKKEIFFVGFGENKIFKKCRNNTNFYSHTYIYS